MTIRRLRRHLGRIAFYLLIAAIILYAVFPFYWAIVSSLKSGSALFEVEFWPRHPTLENYVALFRERAHWCTALSCERVWHGAGSGAPVTRAPLRGAQRTVTRSSLRSLMCPSSPM